MLVAGVERDTARGDAPARWPGRLAGAHALLMVVAAQESLNHRISSMILESSLLHFNDFMSLSCSRPVLAEGQSLGN